MHEAQEGRLGGGGITKVHTSFKAYTHTSKEKEIHQWYSVAIMFTNASTCRSYKKGDTLCDNQFRGEMQDGLSYL